MSWFRQLEVLQLRPVTAAAGLMEHERPVLAGQPPQQVCCGGGQVDPAWFIRGHDAPA
jgi:hypothetical protein